jgi:hypothetical protein
MARHDDLGLHLGSAGDGGVEVVKLEPQENAVAVRFVITVTDRPVVVLHVEAVQLQNEPTGPDQSLVLRAAVRAAATQEPLVPSTTGCDVADGDEGLRTHPASVALQARRWPPPDGVRVTPAPA